MTTVLVTGGGGFAAYAVLQHLARKGHQIRAVVRGSRVKGLSPTIEQIFVPDLLTADCDALLKGVDAVVHLSGRAHRMGKAANDLDSYEIDNVLVTTSLAVAAERHGIRKFIFASSVKAMGECSSMDDPWTEADVCRPQGCYGRSKLRAEESIRALPSLGATILRLPLLYGPGVKGNMATLWDFVRRGIPLPLANVRNRRSLLYVGNLADAIQTCLTSEDVQGRTFLLSDGEDMSTPDLIRAIARAQGVPARLFPFPTGLLRLAATIFGKGEAAARLLESLCVNNSEFQRATGWRPPFSVAQAMKATAKGKA